MLYISKMNHGHNRFQVFITILRHVLITSKTFITTFEILSVFYSMI